MTSRLTWTCDACGFWIPPRDGIVHIRVRALIDPDADPEPWAAHHDNCLPDPDDIGYEIDVDQLRTVPYLLRWTLHLAEKTWYADSGWDDFIARQTGIDLTPPAPSVPLDAPGTAVGQ